MKHIFHFKEEVNKIGLLASLQKLEKKTVRHSIIAVMEICIIKLLIMVQTAIAFFLKNKKIEIIKTFTVKAPLKLTKIHQRMPKLIKRIMKTSDQDLKLQIFIKCLKRSVSQHYNKKESTVT